MIQPAAAPVEIHALPKAEPRVFSLGGIDATETFLNLHPSLTETQEREIIGHIRTAGRGMPWWVGDFAEYYSRKLDVLRLKEEAAAKAEARPKRAYAEYAETLAKAWGFTASHIRVAAAVSRFYPISQRHPRLTWRHHMDAMREVGGKSNDLRGALALLATADREGWSCSDLRAASSTQSSDPAPQLPAPPEANEFAPLDDADKWINQSMSAQLKSIDRDRAASLLVRFHAIAEFIDHLRALTGLNADGIRNINSRFASSASTSR